MRESGGTALAVSDAEMVRDMKELGALEGISAAPEGGASLTALKHLLSRGVVAPSETVVLFNTGGALKYSMCSSSDNSQFPNPNSHSSLTVAIELETNRTIARPGARSGEVEPIDGDWRAR